MTRTSTGIERNVLVVIVTDGDRVMGWRCGDVI